MTNRPRVQTTVQTSVLPVGVSLRAIVDRADRACAGVDTEVFFPRSRTSAGVEYAKAHCRCCPIVATCLAYALTHEVDGIWGDTTEAERASLQAQSVTTAAEIASQAC